MEIIKGVAPYYEEFHHVKISPEHRCARRCCCRERYITDRFLPDKAIDLIDEACSDMNLQDTDITRRMELQAGAGRLSTVERETHVWSRRRRSVQRR